MMNSCDRCVLGAVALVVMSSSAFLNASCTSEEALIRQWRERREMDVGMSPERATNGKTPVSVQHVSAELDEYAFSDDGCLWTYVVNRETELIEDWRYDSKPENCQISSCFSCSW